jgi:choline-glycine betaine transporter
MAESIITFLFLAGVSTFCWVMVFRSSARRKSNEPAYDFWRMTKQGREDWDAISLAGYLIIGMVFSLITLVFLVVGIVRLAAR